MLEPLRSIATGANVHGARWGAVPGIEAAGNHDREDELPVCNFASLEECAGYLVPVIAGQVYQCDLQMLCGPLLHIWRRSTSELKVGQ